MLLFYSGKSNQEARELRNKVRDSGSAKVIDGYTTPSKGAEMAYQEIVKVLKIVSSSLDLYRDYL